MNYDVKDFKLHRGLLAHLSRRGLLRRGALAVGGTALGSNFFEVAAAPLGQPIIDAHIHLYDPTRPGGIHWPPRDNAILYSPHLPRQFRTVTEGLGVVGAVVIEAEARPDDNRWVLDLAKTEPLIVGYIGRLTLGQSDFTSNFDRYVENPIFRGLRLKAEMLADGMGQKMFEADLQRVAERQLTLDLVGGAALLPHLPRIAKTAPGLRLVIDHLPFAEWERDPAAMRTALREAALLPNVYAKISDVLRRVDGRLMTDAGYYRPRLDALWELFGEDRVIYGSNWPVSDLVAPYASVLKIVADYVNGRGPVAAEKYFWRNSFAAYRWQPRGAAGRLVRPPLSR
jgi:L-fuconolactonase